MKRIREEKQRKPVEYAYQLVISGTVADVDGEGPDGCRQAVLDSFKPDLLAGVGEPSIIGTVTRLDGNIRTAKLPDFSHDEILLLHSMLYREHARKTGNFLDTVEMTDKTCELIDDLGQEKVERLILALKEAHDVVCDGKHTTREALRVDPQHIQ